MEMEKDTLKFEANHSKNEKYAKYLLMRLRKH